MSTAEAGTWRRTSPFAILFFLGRIFRLIAKNAWQSLAPLIALLVAYEGDIVSKLMLASIGFSVFITVSAILSYWFFRFQISADSILIRQGVFKKKQLDIKFERIQGINSEQGLVYRLLGLVTVSFDTAGSDGNEGNLPAVTQGFADSLRERLGTHLPANTADEDDETECGTDALVQLDWRDMVRIGLADRRALILFAFIGPFIERIDDGIDRYLTEFVQVAAANGVEFDAIGSISIAITIFFAVVLLFVVVSIAAAFLRYNSFRLFLHGQTLRSHAGLLTAHEHSMELGKIQTLRLEQGIMLRLMKRFRLTARQAISGRKGRGKVFVVPVVTAELADYLHGKLFAPEGGRLSQNPASTGFATISPYSMRSRILFVGVLPAVLATALLMKPFGAFALFGLLWLPIVAAAAYQNWKRAGYAHDDDEIVRRSGLLGYRTVGLLFRKVQRVTVNQSRYQRRLNLATLHMYMASGSVKVP
ncbi:MAG: PH domain-containing protein, partial [Woeseia sp.]